MGTTTGPLVDADRFASLLAEARSRGPEAMGPLLEGCRQYLTLVAECALGRELLGKAGASDLVQETFLEAHRHVEEFRGRSQDELRSWLRRILECRAANARRRFLHTQKRARAREVPLDVLDSCGGVPGQAIRHATASPSQHAIRNELTATLERALNRLPDHYRRAVTWRQQERLTFQEIGDRIGLTADAARKLWGRAILQLRRELDNLA